MFRSRYTDEEKKKILEERILNGLSVRATCEKYGITVQTFYLWQRKLNDVPDHRLELEPLIPEIQGQTPELENRILRRLYIDLSAHNYELAKFLEK